ncbi:lytic transglycosylase domain-containing protein [Actinoplanes sp. NPDC048796]|uniref:aggregation-promoting factor C-terminal-like domain-containing protein n=1 Tax=Actinoplanes sp. NPDC048796 TaxID=3155640 RepID=UPI0034069A91
MERRLGRLGVRAASVGLLLAGLVGGVYLGKERVDASPAASGAPVNLMVEAQDLTLLKQRQATHAAARAWQREAEGAAAAKAAAAAKLTAARAHELEKQVIEDKKKAEAKKKALENGGPVPYSGPIPGSCNEFSGSREIGCALMLEAGFGIDQFPCLNKLWDAESGWNYKAENKSSGAYGIPQSLPGKKMASEGADWKTNPATQIKWGLGYVKGRYKTPCGAWQNFQNNGNY